MDWQATHAGFVIASYALSAIVLAGLGLSIVWRDRATARQLQQRQPHDQAGDQPK